MEDDGRVVRQFEVGCAEMRFYGVYGIFQSPDKGLWVVGKLMREVESPRGRRYTTAGATCAIIELGKGVRRAGAAHICDEGCSFDARGNTATHSRDVCAGGVYEVWRREEGYPPHMG